MTSDSLGQKKEEKYPMAALNSSTLPNASKIGSLLGLRSPDSKEVVPFSEIYFEDAFVPSASVDGTFGWISNCERTFNRFTVVVVAPWIKLKSKKASCNLPTMFPDSLFFSQFPFTIQHHY